MGLSKDQKEKIEEMAARYAAKLEQRAAEGKPLGRSGQGRRPNGVSEENLEEFRNLKTQIAKIKELRKESTVKLAELKEQLDALREAPTGKKRGRKPAAK